MNWHEIVERREPIALSKLTTNRGQIPGVPKNPRFIKTERYEKLKQSIEEDPEMLDVREVIVYEHEGKYVAIGGNMRLRACRELKFTEVPCKVLRQDTPPEKLRAIASKDNVNYGEFDMDILANEWNVAELDHWGVDLPDFAAEAEKAAAGAGQGEAKEDDFDKSKDGILVRCKPGEIWQLGDHRLMCGDSTDLETVKRLMGGAIADLVFTDPPYGMGKKADGVQNDNLYRDELLKFNRRWIPNTFAVLKDSGSWYCWGIDEPLMDIYCNILKPMIAENRITFRNLVTWDKESCQSMSWDGARSYPRVTEKCLFVMCGVQGFNTNSDNYWDKWDTIRLYMEGEAKRVGLTPKKLKEIVGVGMYSHWFTKSQWELIGEKYYKRLQEHYKTEAFRKDYEELRKDYEELRKDYYGTRAFFDNTHDNMTDVWHFGRTTPTERADCGGHATPKPIELCARAIKSSSRPGELVLDVFGGSGSTLMACEQLGRRCCMLELDPHYCDVILARWEKLTGREAVKIE